MKMVVMSSVYSKPPNNAVFILISEVHLNTTCGWNRCDISSFTWTLIGRWELSLGQLEIIFGSSTERLQIAAEVTRSLWNFLIKWKPSAAASTSLPSDPNDLGSRSTQHLEIVGKYSMLISIIFHVPLNRMQKTSLCTQMNSSSPSQSQWKVRAFISAFCDMKHKYMESCV